MTLRQTSLAHMERNKPHIGRTVVDIRTCSARKVARNVCRVDSPMQQAQVAPRLIEEDGPHQRRRRDGESLGKGHSYCAIRLRMAARRLHKRALHRAADSDLLRLLRMRGQRPRRCQASPQCCRQEPTASAIATTSAQLLVRQTNDEDPFRPTAPRACIPR